MATQTENLGLTLPASTDPVDIGTLNANFETLDTAYGTQSAATTRLLDAGAKNLIRNTAASTTKGGIDFTVNSDGTVTANGTATAGTWLILSDNNTLKAGNYVVSGGTAAVRVVISTSTSATDIIAQSLGAATGFTLDTDTSGLIFAVRLSTGAVADNMTVYPMICTAADYAVSPGYVPYVPTLAELYAMVQALQNGGA